MATAPGKSLSPKDAEDGEEGRDPNSPPVLLQSDLSDHSKRGRLQRRLLRSLYRQRHLTVHVLGVRGDVEMECQWTSVLKRIPKLRTLQMIFIGFQDPDDRWSRGLREGVISPPLTKSQGLSGGKKLTCRLFKGLYQLFQHVCLIPKQCLLATDLLYVVESDNNKTSMYHMGLNLDYY